MKKKLLSLTLALVMCLALLPAPAAALSDGTFKYTLSGDEVYITTLIDTSIENLVIPSSINGKPVVKVGLKEGESAVEFTKVKSIVVPNTVKELTNSAFSRCVALSSVTLPDGLETIGESAFWNTNLTSVVISESVTKIGDTAFYANTNLTSVTLPKTLAKIPANAFSRCKSLKTIEIPASVTEIGRAAFVESGLESVKIPSGVKKLNWTFKNCAALANVELPAGLTTIGMDTFADCTSLTSILIPTTVTEIGSEAFYGSGLEEIILPYGVTSAYDCFKQCKNLTAVYAPSTLTAISAPSNCIVYCMPGSKLEAYCKKNNISYATDASCDTRINVLYNGKRVSFGAYGQNPEIVNNRTMVPLRSIFEAMGADVQWDAATKTVTAARGSNKIVMTLGQAGYQVNGVSKTMDTPPMLLNSRTMVPVRVVAESFGADVTWHGASATVIISE